MLDFEQDYWINNYNKILGCDEVGRGCCAGPLVVAAVIFPPFYQNQLINDSKKMSDLKRRELVNIIKKDALEFKYFVVDSKLVDNLNPKKASIYAMQEVIKKFNNLPDLVLTDFEKIDLNIKQINLVKGDQKSISIAAASILAKVFRDDYMIDIAKKFPDYGFEKHKGYCTKEHQNAMEKYGVIEEHRISYKNVKHILENKN